ncbi:CAP domain-containing protein [Aquimarina sp. U1-2]|uniref:CAP domain-containing protein n=1 Tax=Aquimarina sp. U1-2 TaxID=2823141 RepID=UPI001AECAEDE|nr:CAP domain-containing protein [Aquimarina sp. U1-2]MBP2834047.1 CAP domain-containing protein [Aquimarina sp. U1-2]
MKIKTFYPFILLALLVTVYSCSEDDTIREVSMADEILELVNIHRQSIGLSTVSKNSTAEELAIAHSEYMISQGAISHDNQDAKFRTLRDVENARSFAENVASGQRSAQSVMEAWLNSEGHRTNIEGNYTHIGIGVVQNDNGRYYFTQIFYR